ncbi:hypothetical protein CPU12_11395 [Malaciobacter molluscorum LMG 25693]|uniref:NosL domain-containing protein n=1 Tax=Malaciobacter molluscorum LMG 25693 TaxID=870501 RepID=A0A2G1DFD6_9BACT|nr:nitrous oxide reductase accessory protein NosL [Malaciobacter molluscorum]AXX91806.1 NosL domain-containing protein [Malaciobacter molluscorum LMG 25693]PHO17201.1 hypothetical protein CPU12_11395 [Malaciobacter molluscorum LMG 25693]
MLKKVILFFLLFNLSLFAAMDMNHQHNHMMFQTVEKKDAKLVKTDKTKYSCDICGMNLIKFNKTSHAVEFKDGKKQQYCSLHCLSEVYKNHKNNIKSIQVVDTKTLNLIDAKKAYYVVGSSKPGTMSMISKYAFKDKKNATSFQKKFGGEIKTFEEALNIAINSLPKDNTMIDKKRVKMAKKGKKIYETMCIKTDTPKFHTVAQAKKYLIDNNICKNVKPMMIQAVAIYKFDPSLADNTNKKISIPKDAKCPVCGMYVAKHPKWAALIEVNNSHTHYFDGAKDMFKFYLNPSKFSHSHTKDEMKNIIVSDYYTLEKIDAKKAFYVIGSNVYGPMGKELIPFKTQKEANTFMKNHYGKKVLKFHEVKEDILY